MRFPSQHEILLAKADVGIKSLRQLMPDDPNPQLDPNWSQDGSKIVFGGESSDAAATIRVLDLTTHQVSTLPGSKGLFAPRWSADGRYIPAMSGDSTKLLRFDFQTAREKRRIMPLVGLFSVKLTYNALTVEVGTSLHMSGLPTTRSCGLVRIANDSPEMCRAQTAFSV